MRSLLKMLGLGGHGADPRESSAVTATADRLKTLSGPATPGSGRASELAANATFFAALAHVLARVARADLDVSEAELAALAEVLAEISDTPRLAAEQAFADFAAELAARHTGSDDYLVTRHFRDLSERPERIRLVRAAFAVAAADGSISQVEDQTIAQIGVELGLTTQEVARCRGEFRAHLATLQQMPSQRKDPPGS